MNTDAWWIRRCLQRLRRLIPLARRLVFPTIRCGFPVAGFCVPAVHCVHRYCWWIAIVTMQKQHLLNNWYFRKVKLVLQQILRAMLTTSVLCRPIPLTTRLLAMYISKLGPDQIGINILVDKFWLSLMVRGIIRSKVSQDKQWKKAMWSSVLRMSDIGTVQLRTIASRSYT